MSLPVVVLVGGLATRLRPVTEKMPKSAITIKGKPFILHQLDLFRNQGIDHVHLCLGYLGEMVVELVTKSIFPQKMKITFSFDGERLMGTGGAIKKALHHLPDLFFVTYGDSYLDLDYSKVELFFHNAAALENGLMTVFKNENKFDDSNVVFENNSVIYYSKKQKTVRMNYIDYGLGILRKTHFNPYPDGDPFDLSEIYEDLSAKGALLGYEVPERFYEIGSLKGIKDLNNYLETKKI